MKIHRRTRAGLVIAGTLLLAPCARAEEAPALRPGVRVRITGGDAARFVGTASGTLVNTGPDTITLVTDQGVLKLPTGSITRVEVSHGRKRHGRLGLLVGVAAGALIGLYATTDPALACGVDYYVPCTRSDRITYAAVMGLALAAPGALVGRRIHTETWSDAPLGRLRVAVVPERNGGRVAFALSF